MKRADVAARNRARHAGEHLYEDAAWMRAAYVDRSLSLRQVAIEAGCGLRTVARWMEIHEIETRRGAAASCVNDRSGPNSGRWKGGPPTCSCGVVLNYGAMSCNACRDRNGERNPRWLGDAPNYASAHDRVHAAKGSARDYDCVACGDAAEQWAYDNADPNERLEGGLAFSASPDHYQPMCQSCHKRFDATRRRVEIMAYRQQQQESVLSSGHAVPM